MRWVVVLVLAGCGRIGFDQVGQGDSGDGGGDPDAIACTFGPWSTPIHQASLGSNGDESAPALHPNGQVLVFERGSDLYAATRAGTMPFSAPVAVAALNSGSNDSSPTWSSNGTQLYFTSNRNGSYRLWVSAFDGSTFGTPTEFQELNQIDGAALSHDGLELIYCTVPAPNDLGRATRATLASAWVDHGTTDFTVVNTTSEGYPTLSSDGTTLYFSSTRSGGNQLFVTTRATVGQPFGTPTPVAELDTAGSNIDANLSDDGATMIFASDRLGGATGYELFIATRACM